ncbi:hypothetical protein [Mucilaginibacter sp.]|uniref:hypothetical protein n=1 Tax=Mucilaginibacter sp. TaxID=1882438 RepID=UPI0035BC0725
MATIASLVVLLSALLWVFGSLITKSSKGESTSVMNASIQLLAAGLVCGLISVIKGEYIAFSFAAVKWQAWGGLIFLIVMGSLVAYLSFIWLLTI